ncbi:MAG: DUF2232 domain-containing protein [Veillonella sp.]|uniref:DUF2232 domain-containing protein n=1 Tax=Veillonella sp. TaxID=1926307 RepID=UPI00290E1DD3|nr:DUF2232 domain-containing protein [Veillonella sp.]MDU3601544.1 DUF2232 domain-containing protein [Veillonella sp.]MDU3705461.1 DUF2232 domain-containing protein [Veillonella sp.]
MKQTNTRAMVETAFVSAIGVVLTAISVYLPILGFLSFLVTPAAVGIIGTKWGFKYSFVGTIVIFFLSTMLFGIVNSFVVGLFTLVGIGVGAGNRFSWPTIKRLLVPSVLMFLAIFFVIIVSYSMSGVDVSTLGPMVIEQAQIMAHDAMATNPAITQEQADQFVDNVQKNLDTLGDVFCMAIAVGAIVYTYITIQISLWLGRRLRISIPNFLPIEQWKMPIWGAGIFALGIIGVHGSAYVHLDTPWVIAISKNLVLLGNFICSIHGFAALADIMTRYRVAPKIKWGLVFAYALFFSQALAIFGIIDMFLDLRSRFNQRGY